MTKPTFKDIKAQAEEIYQLYDARFAGKARATRDIELLDDLLGRLGRLIDDGRTLLNGSRDPALMSVLEMATSNLEVYETERKAIVLAHERGPTSAESSRLVSIANLTFGKYHRHYAGKERRTRDLGLMDEIIADLENIHEQLGRHRFAEPEEVGANLAIIVQNLGLYRTEREHIAESRRSGTHAEQADALATLANEQFKIYREQFAGKGRPSRRPALLERVNAQLEEIHKEMRRLADRGYDSDSNKRNMGIVRQNLEMYRGEIAEIKKLRATIASDDLVGNLGGAANDVMAQYRENFAGKDRRSRDLELLSSLCDMMGELARQMDDLEQVGATPANTKNLAIVMDTLSMYESEYRHIEEAKAL
ncbi:MAG: hypothetical protein H0U74_18095 [Bradymonadaceae bacterium]|nr:hypothetical protein [Lujinxingiaceae bacterium]